MVTAETALLLPVLVLIVVVCLAGLSVGFGRARCADAARVAATELAHGATPAVAVAAATRVAPPGATVQVDVSGDEVQVSVRAAVRPWGGPFGRLLSADVSAQSTALINPRPATVPAAR